MWTATHKKSGLEVELTDDQKAEYQEHPATKGLYRFQEIKDAKEIKSLAEDEKSKKSKK